MSKLIVDILATYARDQQRPTMIIASRNQIDADSGYVMTTKELAEQVLPLRSPYLRICRDHCGPYFLDIEKGLSLRDAVEATKKTIAADVEQGFDLIHIDTSRCDTPYQIAEELIGFSLSLNPNIRFEFGTEENVGVAAGIQKYQDDVNFAKQFPNMDFVVAQTGSLVMEDQQVGTFDTEIVGQLVGFANDAGVKLKEHNADYLTLDQINLRKTAGVHALNIAPQLGVVQTKTILQLAKDQGINTVDFEKAVLTSGKWQKWRIDCNDLTNVAIAGHYCFNSVEYLKLIEQLDYETAVRSAIIDVLDPYYSILN